MTGVGQNDNTAITARIVDETGTTVVDPNLSLLVTLRAKPDGGEVISGEAPTPPGGLVTDTDEIEIDASSGSGTFNLRSGILPGVVEIRLQVYENGSAYFTSLGTEVVIVTPQISIASGPPNTMVLSAPTLNAVVDLNTGGDAGIPLTPGFYSRRAGLIVTDRYGNAVPDGTTINLGFLDSVISAGEQGETLGDFRMRDNSGIDFTADTIIRDGLIREIEPNDRVVLFDVPASDVSRFVDAGGIFANRVLATKAYNNTASNLEYAVGASLLEVQSTEPTVQQPPRERYRPITVWPSSGWFIRPSGNEFSAGAMVPVLQIQLLQITSLEQLTKGFSGDRVQLLRTPGEQFRCLPAAMTTCPWPAKALCVSVQSQVLHWKQFRMRLESRQVHIRLHSLCMMAGMKSVFLLSRYHMELS